MLAREAYWTMWWQHRPQLGNTENKNVEFSVGVKDSCAPRVVTLNAANVTASATLPGLGSARQPTTNGM